jgi:glutathione S-transferase
MWQAFELAMAKEFRLLMYLRVVGPYDRLRPRDEILATARRSTDDPAHLEWVARVYDGTAVSTDEAGHLESLLLQRLDRLDRALVGRDYLVGDRFTIADLSVLPGPCIRLSRCIRFAIRMWCAGSTRVGQRPAMVQSEGVRPADAS